MKWAINQIKYFEYFEDIFEKKNLMVLNGTCLHRTNSFKILINDCYYSRILKR